MFIDTTLLANTYDHYFTRLPDRISLLASQCLNFLFSRIKIDLDPEIIDSISKDDIVIFTTKYESYFEYLFYYTRFKQAGLRFPEIGFDHRIILFQPISRIIRVLLSKVDFFLRYRALPCPYERGYYERELISGRAGLFSLINKKTMLKTLTQSKKDPLRFLIELQQTVDRPVIIVPLILFFSKEPQRNDPNIWDMLFNVNTTEKPSIRKRLKILFNTPEKIFSEISEPLNLQHFLALPEIQELSTLHSAHALRQHLLIRINLHRQSVTGPILKKRAELKEDILSDNALQKYIERQAKMRNVPVEHIQREADSYFEEIAANFKISFIKIGAGVVRWILKTMFDGISIEQKEFNRVKSMAKHGPLILIPCHKSHMDYLIVSYVFYLNNMAVPHIVAGKNLSFWPFNTLFRGVGAFFVRRTFSGAVLYSKVFAGYVQKLLEEGFNIELFFEGTRSRSGKLITPQLGFLSILLTAFKNNVCNDIIFVPIHIGYDRVVEEGAYLREVEGGEKEPESLKKIIKARRLLKNRYGRIYLKFHEPIALKTYLERQDTPLFEMTSKQQNAVCRDLGNKIANAINTISVVTPNALVAGAILNQPQATFSYSSLYTHIQTYVSYLMSLNAHLADSLYDQEHSVGQVIDTYIRRRFIERLTTEDKRLWPERKYRINESKRTMLEYYKNNCLIFFVPAAFTALAILERDAFLFHANDLHAGYAFLAHLFQNEFTYDTGKTSEYFIRKNVKTFIDDAIVTPHATLPETYNLTSAGLRKLQYFASFLKNYFESYWIALNFFMQHPKNTLASKDRIKKMQVIGERMYKTNEIQRKEALSKINFKNAELFFLQNGVRGSEDTEKIAYFADAVKRYLSL